MPLYNVEFRLGQAIIKANRKEAALRYAEREWGSYNGPYKISRATKADESWVKSMGGAIHDITDSTLHDFGGTNG